MAFAVHAISWYAGVFVLTLYNRSLTLHAESQQFSSLVEKNKQSTLKWRSLTDEERDSYCRDAAAHNFGDAVVNEKKEVDKIIRHIVDMVSLSVT